MHLSHNYSTIISWLCLKIGYTYPSMAFFLMEQWPFSMGFLGTTLVSPKWPRWTPQKDSRRSRWRADRPPATAAVLWKWTGSPGDGGIGTCSPHFNTMFSDRWFEWVKGTQMLEVRSRFSCQCGGWLRNKLDQTFQKCLLKRCSWGLTWMWFTKVAGASQLMGVRFGYKQFEPQLHPAVGTSSFTIFDCTDINVKWIDPHFGIHIRKNEWCTQWIGPRNSFKNIFKYLGKWS